MRRIKQSLSFWQDSRSTAALIKKLTTSRHIYIEEIFYNSAASAFSNYADCCTWVPLLFLGFRWLKKRNKARAGPKRPPPLQGTIRKLGVSSPPVPKQPPVQHGPCLCCQPRLRVKTHSHTRYQTGSSLQIIHEIKPQQRRSSSPPEHPGPVSVLTTSSYEGNVLLPWQGSRHCQKSRVAGTCCHLTCSSAVLWKHKSYWHVWIPEWFRLCLLGGRLQL